MTLRGTGMLITYMDIDAADDAEFNQWYDGEHLAERVAIPGFTMARRYLATGGSPKYLAFYETEDIGVLAGEPYRRALNSQTAWSRAVMARFRQPGRIIAEVRASLGRGRGGAAGFIRFAPAADTEEKLGGWLLDAALPALLGEPGIVAVHWLVNDAALSLPLDRDGRPVAGAPPAPTTWILIVEATTVAALAAAPDVADLVAAGAGPDVHVGTFRLMWELASEDLS